MSRLLRFAIDVPRLGLRTVVSPLLGRATLSAERSDDEQHGSERTRSRRMTAEQLDRVEL